MGETGWEIRFNLDEDTHSAVSEHAYILEIGRAHV